MVLLEDRGARSGGAWAPRDQGWGHGPGSLEVTSGSWLDGDREQTWRLGPRGLGEREVRLGGRGRVRVAVGKPEGGQNPTPSANLLPLRAPLPILTSSGLPRMAAVAAQSRFSSPAGTRPAGKFVSSSTNGISSGKAQEKPPGRKHGVQVGDLQDRAVGSRGGAPRKPAPHWLGRYTAPPD